MQNNGHKTYYDLKGLNRWGILIPTTVPTEVVLRIAAALLSYEMQAQSVDYQLKKWRMEWEETIEAQHTESH